MLLIVSWQLFKVLFYLQSHFFIFTSIGVFLIVFLRIIEDSQHIKKNTENCLLCLYACK